MTTTIPWEAIEKRAQRHLSGLRSLVRFHGRRIPRYLLLIVVFAPRGAWRFVSPVARWVLYTDGYEAAKTVTSRVGIDGRGASQVRDIWRDYRRWVLMRLGLVAGALLLIVVATVYLVDPADDPLWVKLTMLALAVIGLGVRGRPDRGILSHPASHHRIPPLSPALVVEALRVCGLARVERAIRTAEKDGKDPVRFVTDTTHTGSGVEIHFDMPGGVPASDLMLHREDLASALSRQLACVWPLAVPEIHAGRCRLVILDKPMGGEDRIPWPYANEDQHLDIFRDPITIGVDAGGNPVHIWLRYCSGLIGARPRMGKSFLARLLLASALQDDRVELHLFALRATGEFDSLRELCAVYRSGDRPDDLDAIRKDLRWLCGEIRRRADLINELPDWRTEESKVTSELAHDKDLGLHPIILYFDEIQLATLSVHGDEIQDMLHEIGSIGQAVGVSLLGSTQKPSTDFLRSSIRDNMTLRLAMALTTQQANDMTLGQGMHGAGIRATEFSGGDLGMVIAISEGDPQIGKAFYTEASTVRAKIERIKARRLSSGGVLVGQAVGEVPMSQVGTDTDVEGNLLSDILLCWPVEDDLARTREIVDAMVTANPDYEGLTPMGLTLQLKGYGVNGSVNVQRDGVNGRGHSRKRIALALSKMTDDER